MQYLSLASPVNEATVGIESADNVHGLTVYYDEDMRVRDRAREVLDLLRGVFSS